MSALREQCHHQPSLMPRHELRLWMERADLSSFTLRELERLSLRGFLEQTHAWAIPPGERLRELAMFVEEIATRASQPRGWQCLQRIYTEAHRQSPEDAWIGHSQARSSIACVARRLSSQVREDILLRGHAAVEQALFVHPHHPLLLSVMGEICVCLERDAAALEWFSRALHRDPQLPHAALERARLLREDRRWSDAVDAYDAVPAALLTGPVAWRAARLCEQRGWCHLQLGAHAQARQDFLSALAQYEQDIDLAEQAMGRDLVLAAVRFYPMELRARTHALAEEIEWDWAVDLLLGD